MTAKHWIVYLFASINLLFVAVYLVALFPISWFSSDQAIRIIDSCARMRGWIFLLCFAFFVIFGKLRERKMIEPLEPGLFKKIIVSLFVLVVIVFVLMRVFFSGPELKFEGRNLLARNHNKKEWEHVVPADFNRLCRIHVRKLALGMAFQTGLVVMVLSIMTKNELKAYRAKNG